MPHTEQPGATVVSSYKFRVTEHIRFADLDFLGHVNNVAFTKPDSGFPTRSART